MPSSSSSGEGVRVRVSRCMVGGEVTVLRVMGLVTLSHTVVVWGFWVQEVF